MTRWRRIAVTAAVALTAASCSQPPDAPRIAPERMLHAEAASYDMAVGEKSRFIVGLFTGDELFVGYGTVDMSFSFLGEKGASGEPEPGPQATGEFVLVPGTEPDRIPDVPVAVPASKGRGVYAADVTFDRPGFWEVTVTADIEERGTLTATAAFVVFDAHRVPAPGDRAPKTSNLTAASRDGAPREAVDSRWSEGNELPDPLLHRTTIASSIKEGRPVLAVFSTPVFCVSRFCGPVTDMVAELARDYSDRADFVHIEIWRDFQDGVINEAAAKWLFRDDDLREPWVFLIGGDGRIKARWDNVATRAEIEPYLKRLPRKREPLRLRAAVTSAPTLLPLMVLFWASTPPVGSARRSSTGPCRTRVHRHPERVGGRRGRITAHPV